MRGLDDPDWMVEAEDDDFHTLLEPADASWDNMPDINTVTLVGKVTKAPIDIRDYSIKVAQFSLYVKRNWPQPKDKEGDFFRVTCFRFNAGIVEKFLRPGMLVGIEGQLSMGEWTTTTGEKRAKLEIVANSVRVLDYEFRPEIPEDEDPGYRERERGGDVYQQGSGGTQRDWTPQDTTPQDYRSSRGYEGYGAPRGYDEQWTGSDRQQGGYGSRSWRSYPESNGAPAPPGEQSTRLPPSATRGSSGSGYTAGPPPGPSPPSPQDRNHSNKSNDDVNAWVKVSTPKPPAGGTPQPYGRANAGGASGGGTTGGATSGKGFSTSSRNTGAPSSSEGKSWQPPPGGRTSMNLPDDSFARGRRRGLLPRKGEGLSNLRNTEWVKPPQADGIPSADGTPSSDAPVLPTGSSDRPTYQSDELPDRDPFEPSTELGDAGSK